jgi:MFS transporter, YNFM family, putative membrane transport protein
MLSESSTSSAIKSLKPSVIPTRMPSKDVSRIRLGTHEYRNTTRAMTLGGFATFALLYGMQPLMPVFSLDFQVTPATASGVVSAATGAMALALIPASLLANRFGRKSVMNVSLFLSAALTLACPLVGSFNQLLILRALLGVALAGLPAVAMAYLSEEINADVLGRAMGMYIAGNALGGMFGRFAMAILADWVTWRVATVVLGGLALASAIEFWRSLPASRHFRQSRVTVRRTVVAARRHFLDDGLPWLFLTGFILMGCFVSLFNYLAYRLAADPYNFSQSRISVIYSMNAAGIFAAGWVGVLADRFGRRNVLWIMVLSMLFGLVLTLSSPILLIYVGTAIFSFGFFGGHSVASSWLGFRALNNKALATALYLSIYYLGSSCLGTLTGITWKTNHWNGIVCVLSVLLFVAFAIAMRLRKLAPRVARAYV